MQPCLAPGPSTPRCIFPPPPTHTHRPLRPPPPLPPTPAPCSGGWELLDYGDVVVHILTAEQRDYYDLESFYGAAEEVPLPFGEAAADVDTWAKKL